jgi:hypothetical protein
MLTASTEMTTLCNALTAATKTRKISVPENIAAKFKTDVP